MDRERLVGRQRLEARRPRAVADHRPLRDRLCRCGNLHIGHAEQDHVESDGRSTTPEGPVHLEAGRTECFGERAPEATRADYGQARSCVVRGLQFQFSLEEIPVGGSRFDGGTEVRP